MFTTLSTYYTFPKTIEQIRQNMTGHVTSRYQGLNQSRSPRACDPREGT
jgi:hypothetical protein